MTQQYQYGGLPQYSNGQHQLTPITNLHTRPYQQDSPGPSQILPPIHTQQSNTGSNYTGGPPLYRSHAASAPQTPRTPVGSNTPASTSSAGSFAPSTSQHHGPAVQAHSNFAPIMPPYAGAQSNGMHINSTPQSATNDSPSAYYGQGQVSQLANAVYGAQNRQASLQSYAAHNQASPQTQESSESRLVPVVGSQGRRGILPSAPGRAPPVGSALDGTARGVVPPTKNAEGKYPCLYCNKTYLHLKHLKRHHLRRTYATLITWNLLTDTMSCRHWRTSISMLPLPGNLLPQRHPETPLQ